MTAGDDSGDDDCGDGGGGDGGDGNNGGGGNDTGSGNGYTEYPAAIFRVDAWYHPPDQIGDGPVCDMSSILCQMMYQMYTQVSGVNGGGAPNNGQTLQEKTIAAARLCNDAKHGNLGRSYI